MGSVQRSVLISAIPCKVSPLWVAMPAGSFGLWQNLLYFPTFFAFERDVEMNNIVPKWIFSSNYYTKLTKVHIQYMHLF